MVSIEKYPEEAKVLVSSTSVCYAICNLTVFVQHNSETFSVTVGNMDTERHSHAQEETETLSDSISTGQMCGRPAGD